jgi:transaldolase
MEELVANKIPVNATLIFSKEQAIECANAFARGLKKHNEKIDTVISIFVSRIDRTLDSELEKNNIKPALSGIYNTLNIYESIESLSILGCRVLFASTGVKGDSLSPHYYIENLLAFNSVNTAPIDTIKSFNSFGDKSKKIVVTKEEIQTHFEKIKKIGIDFDKVLDKQIVDGLEQFKDAFRDILESL